jgi:adenylate kinase family enzyme
MKKKRRDIEKIYEKHIKELKNLRAGEKKLIICFSGIPGSGKTFVAKILEKKYKGVRISSDNIRKIIDWLKIVKNKEDKEKILRQYLINFLKNYKFSNKLIILDSSIDRKYKEIFKVAREKRIKIFIVKITASKKGIILRLKKNKGRLKGFLGNFDRWEKDYNNFNKRVKADFVLDISTLKSDLEQLFVKLNNALSIKEKI